MATPFFQDKPTPESLRIVKAFSSKNEDDSETPPPFPSDAVPKRRHLPIEDFYRLKGQTLGHGKYSIVKPAIEKATGKEWAVKVIEKRRVRNPQDLEREIIILQNLNHPHIVTYKETFESPTHLMIVTELLQGGELFDRIVERQFYTEKDAANLLVEILSVVKYLHDGDLVHRDIKPENLLYTDNTDKAKIKLIDFGFAKSVAQGTTLVGLCGTPGYMAPEIHSGSYSKPVDMFSIGVILYILLCGFPPFEDDDSYDYDFPSPEWDNISESAKDLISKLLEMDPSKRYTVDQALKHLWIKTADGRLSIAPALDTLKQFNTQKNLGMGTFRGTTQKKDKEKNRTSVLNVFGVENDKKKEEKSEESEEKQKKKKKSSAAEDIPDLGFGGIEIQGLLKNLHEKSNTAETEQLLFEIEELKKQSREKDETIHKLTTMLQEYQTKLSEEKSLSTVADKALNHLKKQCFLNHVHQFKLKALLAKNKCKQIPVETLWSLVVQNNVAWDHWEKFLHDQLA